MTLPTWERLREIQMMVVDHQSLLVGVYLTEANTVGVASQRAEDSGMQVFTICLDEVPVLVQQLQALARFAQQEKQFQQEASAALMVLAAVERAKESP